MILIFSIYLSLPPQITRDDSARVGPSFLKALDFAHVNHRLHARVGQVLGV